MSSPSDHELSAYLDEMLPLERSAEVEQALREQPEVRQRLQALVQRRDQGGHSIGEIWRRHRLSCPSRHELGSYLLGVLPPAQQDYIEFHLNTIECRVCQANRDDLQSAQQAPQERQQRHHRYFESSAGLLRQSRPEE